MDNAKHNKREPSSLHHYTSIDTLVALFNNVSFTSMEQKKDKNGYKFIFRATNAFCMNDKMEGKLLANEFFTGSNLKEQFKNEMEYIVKKEGEIYCISFCASDRKTCHSGNISMWNMYGNNGSGAILVFNYKKMKDYFTGKDAQLYACEYLCTSKLRKRLEERNKQMKNIGKDDLHKALSDFREESFTIKDWNWEYEQEWRILTKGFDPKYTTNKYGLASYVEISFPVNCLKTIILGPLVDFDSAKKILTEKILSLREVDESIDNINIKQSKLQIR